MKRILLIIAMIIMIMTLSACANKQVASTNLSQSILDNVTKSDVEQLKIGVEQLQASADYNRLKEYTLRHSFEDSYIEFNYTLQKDIYTLINFVYCYNECVTVQVDETFQDSEFSKKVYILIKKYE